MKVKYVGKQPKHVDRLYGTGTRWSRPGDVQEVIDDVARQMISKHADQYGPETAKVNSGKKPPAGKGAASKGKKPPPSGVMIDETPIEQIEDKAVLIKHAETMSVALDESLEVEAMRQAIIASSE